MQKMSNGGTIKMIEIYWHFLLIWIEYICMWILLLLCHASWKKKKIWIRPIKKHIRWNDSKQFVEAISLMVFMFLSNAIDRYGFQQQKNWKRSNKMTSDHTWCSKKQFLRDWRLEPEHKTVSSFIIIYCFIVWKKKIIMCWLCVCVYTKSRNLLNRLLCRPCFSFSS